MLARMPMMTMMPMRGYLSSLFLRRNMIRSRTMVTMSVIMLKCSKRRFRILNGFELNCYSDIWKKASMFSIARGKNYIVTKVPLTEQLVRSRRPDLHELFQVGIWILNLSSGWVSKMPAWGYLKVLLCKTSDALRSSSGSLRYTKFRGRKCRILWDERRIWGNMKLLRQWWRWRRLTAFGRWWGSRWVKRCAWVER